MTLKRAAIIVTSAIALGAAMGLLSVRIIPPAHAAEAQGQIFPCGPLAHAADVAKALGGAPFVTLTADQWQFLRGVFVMAPDTPNALPPGNSAEMSLRPDGSASIVYVDGDTACAPMRLGKDGVDLLMQVGRGDITHSGGPTL